MNVSLAAHTEEDRFFNVRELLHLMGMPEDFQLENPAKDWLHTAADWAREVVKFCRGELEMSTFQFVKQNNLSRKITQADVGPVQVEMKEEPDQASQQGRPPVRKDFSQFCKNIYYKYFVQKLAKQEAAAQMLRLKTEIQPKTNTKISPGPRPSLGRPASV